MQQVWKTLDTILTSRDRAVLAMAVLGPDQGKTALYDFGGGLLAGPNLLQQADLQDNGLVERESLIYRERIIPRPGLVIFGAGHIAVPLAAMGKLLDFDVTVVDDRSQFANDSRFPQADSVLAIDYPQAFERLRIGPQHYLVIVTRGHVHDRVCLELALATEAAYIGMIGSKKKVAEVNTWLRERDWDEGNIRRVFAPVGLDINAQTPAEIAVSILAEVVRERSKQPPAADLEAIVSALGDDERPTWALATIVQALGSTPRGVGARMLVKADGNIIGTVGGGLGEKQVETAALEVIKTGTSTLMTFRMDNTLAASEGMVCGGNFQVFIQPV